jgi:drug/metabolite transporter (DMT)-like permease
VLLGALFAHETLSLRTLLAAGLIIGSVAVVIMAQQMKGKASPVPAVIEPAECAR